MPAAANCASSPCCHVCLCGGSVRAAGGYQKGRPGIKVLRVAGTGREMNALRVGVAGGGREMYSLGGWVFQG